jgi:hypothetical protein
MRKALIVASLLLAFDAAQAAPAVIGVFEEISSANSGSELVSDIRIGFVRTQSGWVSAGCEAKYVGEPKLHIECAGLRDPPAAWTIYDGSNVVGNAKTQGWLNDRQYSHLGALKIVSGSLPASGHRSREYAGWMDTPVRKPLVATNAPTQSLRVRWTKDEVHPDFISQAWPLFHSAAPTVEMCGSEGESAGPARPARMSDMRALAGWRASKRELLLHVSMDPRLTEKCDIQDVPTLWIYRSPEGVMHALPGQTWKGLINFTPDLIPIAFGDFNGDGDEKAIFQFSAYNLDGYILYYDHFRKFARIEWNYH